MAALLILAGVSYLSSPPDITAESLPTSRIIYPSQQATGVAVLLSDLSGWSPREEEASSALVKDGTIVVGADLRDYYTALEKVPTSASISSRTSRM